MAPEELQIGLSPNPPLSDIFQAGVLLYRLLEDGAWPFSEMLDYVTGGAHLRPFSENLRDPETKALQDLAVRMMDVVPARRPGLLGKIEQELEAALAGTMT